MISSPPPLGGRNCVAADAPASVSRVRREGELIWPGPTSAKASCRSFGFSTMPTTRKGRPFTDQLSPILRLSIDATVELTATWPAPVG
jgi:hypothetical protein